YYINKLSKNELIYIFDEFGEIKESEIIADEIIKYRKKKLIETSIDLSKIVEKVIKRRGKIHPATKVFQALRIFVNKEFENLREFLLVFSDYLNKGGLLTVISYHSVEDRIVKNSLKELKDMGKIIFLNKKVITPSESEIKENRRSRSAKLRVVQKV
ncbi:MAG: 16S rRNA (cytosine(1402)-N(4))-methyltransferase, partial [Caldisericia bacterium]